MDSISNIAYSGNGLPVDEITCNVSTVLVPSIDSSIGSLAGVQNISNHTNNNLSTSSTLSSKECLNEIPPTYELDSFDDLQDSCRNNLFGSETNLNSKIVTPTIFENAVNVMRNLFSPVKGHGIFSSGMTQGGTNELMKKMSNGDVHSLCGSHVPNPDEAFPTNNNDKAHPVISSESDQNLTDDTNNSTTFTSIGLCGHDNTNDSYTTTLSRMDESFLSTITHFDDNMQNEIEMSNVSVNEEENYLDGSMNDTMKKNENSLDNTLRKNPSISLTVNEDANKTFEVLKKAEDAVIKELNVGSIVDKAQMQLSDQILSGPKTTKSEQEFKTPVSTSEEKFQSYQESGIFNNGAMSSTPNKRNSMEEIGPAHSSFLNLVSEKLQEFDRMDQENIVECKSFVVEGTDDIKMNMFSAMNPPSETDLSFIPMGNEKNFTEKTSTPKNANVEKFFSTSTIILTNEEHERLDFNTAKEEIDSSQKLMGKEDELLVNDDTSSPNIDFLENQYEPKIKVLESVINFNNAEERDRFETEKNSGEPVESSCPNEVDLGNGSNPCIKSDVREADFNVLNLNRNSSVIQLKPEVYSAEETGIPLASQRSYTVLHEVNPDLHRPVVTEYICDVHAEKLNDIILGNCAFSDLAVFNSCSEEMLITPSKNACNIIQSIEHIRKSDDTESDKTVFVFNNVGKENKDSLPEIPGEIIEKKQDLHANDIDPLIRSPEIDSADSAMNYEQALNQAKNVIATNIKLQDEAPSPATEVDILENEKVIDVYEEPFFMFKNASEGLKTEESPLPISSVKPISDDVIVPASSGENISSGPNSCLNSSHSTEIAEPHTKEEDVLEEPVFNESSLSPKTDASDFQTQMENLTSDLQKLKVIDIIKENVDATCSKKKDSFLKMNDSLVSSGDCASEKNSKNPVEAHGTGFDTELTQFIQEQFTSFDIEKICSVVDDIPELNLSKNIVLASEKFDKSFHEKTATESVGLKTNNSINDNKFVSSALDFLDSIKGKGTGRDYSRESLYVKFDPLLQSKHSTDLLNGSEGDKENLIVSSGPENMVNTETLIPITPLKQTVNGGIPLSPLALVTQKNESVLSTERLNKLWELQSEVTRLRELYAQKEELSKEKMTEYENEIAKLTGRACVLEEKLKESEEMEKSLVKKLNVQNESMTRLKNIVEEYLTYIAKLTDLLEVARMESQKKTEELTEERDYYMNHLQSTEQAFSDLHSKYEKCKKIVEIYKINEEAYKTNIEDFKERIEQYSEKINDLKQNAAKEVNRLQEKINDLRVNHAQEISRFKAQLRKTELKVQTVQDALDQKVKENQELARICDELIDGKK